MTVLENKECYTIKRLDKKSAYLSTPLGEAKISKKQIKGFKQNDKIEAFCYYDKKKILRATTNFDYEVGKIYPLKVVDTSKYGVFFDIGLEFDLLAPREELSYKVFKEMVYPIGIKIDNKNRLYATTKIRDMLLLEHNYKENDLVEGRIYSINKSIGAFVAIDNKYDSLIRIKELKGAYTEGELVKARVKTVKDDGKIELTLRQRGYLEIDSDAKLIYNILKQRDGKIPVGDKSSPLEIYNNFNLSKAAFKRAAGRLYKKGMIRIKDHSIEIKER